MIKSPWLKFSRSQDVFVDNKNNWWLCDNCSREFFDYPEDVYKIEVRFVCYHQETKDCYKIIGTKQEGMIITVETTEGWLDVQVYDELYYFICNHEENWIGLEYREVTGNKL